MQRSDSTSSAERRGNSWRPSQRRKVGLRMRIFICLAPGNRDRMYRGRSGLNVGQASTLRITATPVLRSPSSAVALLRRADSTATEDGEDGSSLPPSGEADGGLVIWLALARSPGGRDACPTLKLMRGPVRIWFASAIPFSVARSFPPRNIERILR